MQMVECISLVTNWREEFAVYYGNFPHHAVAHARDVANGLARQLEVRDNYNIADQFLPVVTRIVRQFELDQAAGLFRE